MEAVLSSFAVHFDLPILDWIAENLHCAFLDFAMPLITVLGNAGIFWILVAVVMLCIPKYRKMGLSVGVALIMGLLICNITLKPLVARIRPYDFHQVPQCNQARMKVQCRIRPPLMLSYLRRSQSV